jgi:MFS family permease
MEAATHDTSEDVTSTAREGGGGGVPSGKRPSVFRHRHFRNVWLGAFGSSVGAWMEFVGVSWTINTKAGADAGFYLGLHAVAQLAPMMLLGVAGGVVADRVDRKKLLLVTQAVMMVIAVALTDLAAFDSLNLPMLMALSTLMGITMAFNVPAWQVLTPRLVPREELTDAIVLNGLQFNIARVLGPALGGVMLAVSGPMWLFAFNSLSFLGVMFAVSTTPAAPAPERNPHDSIWRETKDGLRFTLRSVGPRAAFMAMTVFGFLASPLQRMLPLYISSVYFTRDWSEREKEYGYGSLLAMMGVGAVAGAFIMRAIPKWYPKHHLIPIAVLVTGLCIAGFGFASSPWIGVPFLVVVGAGWLVSFNSMFAAVQLLVPDALRGRAMAVCNTAVYGVMAFSPLLVDAFRTRIAPSAEHGDAWPIRLGLGSTGVIMACAGLVMLIWRTPEVDGIKPGQPGFERKPGLIRGLTGAAHRPDRQPLDRLPVDDAGNVPAA